MKSKTICFYLLILPLFISLAFTCLSCVLRLAYFSLPDSLAEIWLVVDTLTDYLLDALLYFNFGILAVLFLFGTGKERALSSVFVFVLPVLLPVLQFLCRLFLIGTHIPESQLEELFYSDYLTFLTKIAGSVVLAIIAVSFFIHARRHAAQPVLSVVPKAHIMLIPGVYFITMILLTLIDFISGSETIDKDSVVSMIIAVAFYFTGYFLSYFGARVALKYKNAGKPFSDDEKEDTAEEQTR